MVAACWAVLAPVLLSSVDAEDTRSRSSPPERGDSGPSLEDEAFLLGDEVLAMPVSLHALLGLMEIRWLGSQSLSLNLKLVAESSWFTICSSVK